MILNFWLIFILFIRVKGFGEGIFKLKIYKNFNIWILGFKIRFINIHDSFSFRAMLNLVGFKV